MNDQQTLELAVIAGKLQLDKTKLETKVAQRDKTIEELADTVERQGERIDAQVATIKKLRRELTAAGKHGLITLGERDVERAARWRAENKLRELKYKHRG